jgi:N-6 DNA Methylase
MTCSGGSTNTSWDKFAGRETGKDAGAFYTPRSVVRTLVEMVFWLVEEPLAATEGSEFNPSTAHHI